MGDELVGVLHDVFEMLLLHLPFDVGMVLALLGVKPAVAYRQSEVVVRLVRVGLVDRRSNLLSVDQLLTRLGELLQRELLVAGERFVDDVDVLSEERIRIELVRVHTGALVTRVA